MSCMVLLAWSNSYSPQNKLNYMLCEIAPVYNDCDDILFILYFCCIFTNVYWCNALLASPWLPHQHACIGGQQQWGISHSQHTWLCKHKQWVAHTHTSAKPIIKLCFITLCFRLAKSAVIKVQRFSDTGKRKHGLRSPTTMISRLHYCCWALLSSSRRSRCRQSWLWSSHRWQLSFVHLEAHIVGNMFSVDGGFVTIVQV